MSVKYYCDICDSEVFEKEKSKFVCIGTMDDEYPYKYNYVCDSCAKAIRDTIIGLRKKTVSAK